MASTPSKTLLEGKGFSCEAGRQLDRRKRIRNSMLLHLEHTLQRHRDQKGRGQIRQSILGYQTRGGRIVRLKQFGVEMYCCLSSRE